jgi:hypothetical protein
MKNKKAFLLVLLTIIMQRIIISNSSLEYNIFPFLNGVPIVSKITIHNLYLIQWYLPIFFIISYFTGELHELINGYRIYMVIRNYSKIKLLSNTIIKIYGILLIFLFFQLGIFSINSTEFKSLSIKAVILMILMYYFTFTLLILIQFFMEYFFAPQVANLIVNIYIISSITFTNLFTTNNSMKVINYFLLPNYALGFRNGVINNYDNGIKYQYSIAFILLANIFVILLIIMKFNKKDLL